MDSMPNKSVSSYEACESPASDSALGTLSDVSPEEEDSRKLSLVAQIKERKDTSEDCNNLTGSFNDQTEMPVEVKPECNWIKEETKIDLSCEKNSDFKNRGDDFREKRSETSNSSGGDFISEILPIDDFKSFNCCEDSSDCQFITAEELFDSESFGLLDCAGCNVGMEKTLVSDLEKYFPNEQSPLEVSEGNVESLHSNLESVKMLDQLVDDFVPFNMNEKLPLGQDDDLIAVMNTTNMYRFEDHVEKSKKKEIINVLNNTQKNDFDRKKVPVIESPFIPSNTYDVPSNTYDRVFESKMDESFTNLEETSEDDIDPDNVVTASMQFTLNPSSEKNVDTGNEDVGASPRPTLTPGSVSVHLRHEKSPSVSSSSEPEHTSINGISDGNESVNTSPSVTTSPSFELPKTVTRLQSPEGSDVYIVGTAHFSKESHDDVTKIIRAVRPDVIMLELCKSRIAVLQLDEETILKESKSLDFAKLRASLQHYGAVQGMLYFLMLSVSAHITKQLGMAPGGEFRAALSEVRNSVPNCEIHLGDRPINITLARALGTLSVWHKAKLLWRILCSNEPISKEEVEKCKQRDFIEEMLAEMTGEFPGISEVFVNERDKYLAKSLQVAAMPRPSLDPAKNFAPRVVVGVVGIGHMDGMVKNWGKVADEDIPPIMRIPPATLGSRIIRLTLKLSFCGLVVLGVYKCLPGSFKASIADSLTENSGVVSRWIRN